MTNLTTKSRNKQTQVVAIQQSQINNTVDYHTDYAHVYNAKKAVYNYVVLSLQNSQ